MRTLMATVTVVSVLLAPALAQPNLSLEMGVSLLTDGEYELAIPLLEAAATNDSRADDLAAANFYLGVAYLETGDLARATESFLAARRHDPDLSPAALGAPPRAIDAFERATRVETNGISVLEVVPRVAPSSWWARDDTSVTLQLVLSTPTGQCPGTLRADTTVSSVTWTPSGALAAGCPAGVDLAFDDIESVSAAPEGGLVVMMRGGALVRRVFMPEPFAEWFSDGTEKRRWLDQPVEYTVAVRRAARDLLDVLGRPLWTPWSFAGLPLDTDLGPMLAEPAVYDGQPVRVRGRLDRQGRGDGTEHLLVTSSGTVSLTSTSEIEAFFAYHAGTLRGADVTVTGVFQRRSSDRRRSAEAPTYEVSFWDIWSQTGVETTATPPATHTMSDLFESPPPSGQVRVIGQFRGRNRWADKLRVASLEANRSPTDWVLRDGPWAIWVLGEAARNRDWDFSTREYNQTLSTASTWLMVTGEVRRSDDEVSLRGSEVVPIKRPARLTPGSAGGVFGFGGAPVVQLTMPSPGDGVRADGQLRIQFSKPMDPGTFDGQVELRYMGPPVDGDPGFVGWSLIYVEARKLLQVDPGIALQPGRVLELRLSSSIRDITGVALGAPDAQTAGEPITLQWPVVQ